MTTRQRLAFGLVLLVPLGLGTKFYAGPAAGWVHGHAGGVLYVVFWTMVVALAFPSLSPATGAVGVFIVTCGLEFLQLWSPSFLQAPRNSFLGHALLGSTFGWWDFLHYGIGAVAGSLLVRSIVQVKSTAENG
ncbi:MAG: DUF2809 domain-containing protein [Salinibacter sp.]